MTENTIIIPKASHTSTVNSKQMTGLFLFITVAQIITVLMLSAAIIPDGLIGLVFIIIMIIGDSGNPAIFGIIGPGSTEMMIVFPAIIWMMLFGGYLIVQASAQ